MDSRHSQSRKVNRRYRRAAERLWENSSLRDELNDDQAKRMLDWGSAYLKDMVEETAGLPDEEAENILQTQTERVSEMMRQVNGLAKAVRNDDRQELLAQYNLFTRKADELLPHISHTPLAIEKLLDSSRESSDHIIDQLMSLLDGEEE